jgi:hypothetical protein
MSAARSRTRAVHAFFALLLTAIAVLSPRLLLAQGVTTSSINATVIDQQGNPIQSARVQAVHVPSGTRYAGTTNELGRAVIPGMRIGGPYRVTASMVGYQARSVDNVSLTLGVASDLRFQLQALTVQVEGITVEAPTADPIFSSQRTGAATTVAAEALAQLPTINRRVEDFLRLNPQYSATSFGFSFAGQDNRLNNMTVDGSYFNNSFGLAGQPGDRVNTTTTPGVAPISLDAIEQVQVNVSPYDVRQGNFVGAGVNVVTRSGTNEYRGTLYYQTRDNSFVGSKIGGQDFDIGTFQYSQFGATLGGPIIRNRLFFFTSFERDAQTSPGTTWRALGSTPADTTPGVGNTTRVRASSLDSLADYLRTNFGYNPGPYQGYDFDTPSSRFLARVDFNANERNKLTLRFHMLNSSSDILVSNSSSLGLGSRRGTDQSLNFAASNYAILENLRSIVGEWNSQLSPTVSNNMIVGYNSSDESRENNAGPWFPLVEIREGSSNYTTFGFEPFTPANQLRYWNVQFQNNLTMTRGNHAFTLGLSFERYHSLNVFFPGAQSVYVYNSLADFYTDANDYLANPNRTVSPVSLRRFQVRWSNIPGQTQPEQPLDVTYIGLYAQDEWRLRPNLTVIAGLRVDRPSFGNTAYTNTVADAMVFRDFTQYQTGKLPDPRLQFSPRIGFNYDVGGRQVTQIRGGTGLFSGRPAYVWISNQIGNTGVLTGFASIDNTTTRPFNPNPDAYKPATVAGQPPSSFQLALTDPNFRFPQVWRSNLGIDRRLPFLGLTATGELLYTRDINGIAYINANLPRPQSRFTGVDNRPRFLCTPQCNPGSSANRIYTRVTDATVLTNQARGSAYNLAFALERPAQSGLFGKIGFATGKSRNTVDPGSIASGSFTGNAISGDPNEPALGYSQFSMGSRMFLALAYQRDWFGFGATTVSLFWERRTTGNANYTYAFDLNGDGTTGNDLIYIPRDASEMNFVQYCANANASFATVACTAATATDTFTVADQQAAWEAFIQQDPYLSKNRGQYMERNGLFLPMLSRMDVGVQQDIRLRVGGRTNRLSVRLDVLNFLNMLDDNMGRSWRMMTTQPLVSAPGGVADANGAVQYSLRNTAGVLLAPQSFDRTSTFNDTWRMQLTVRYSFNQ